MLSRVQMTAHSALHTAKLPATAACIPAKQKVRTLMEIRNISDIDISHFQSPDSGSWSAAAAQCLTRGRHFVSICKNCKVVIGTLLAAAGGP